MAATIKGIDVSMYQTNVDFAKVKAAGYSFVIIRCNNWDHTKNCVVKDPLLKRITKMQRQLGLTSAHITIHGRQRYPVRNRTQFFVSITSRAKLLNTRFTLIWSGRKLLHAVKRYAPTW